MVRQWRTEVYGLHDGERQKPPCLSYRDRKWVAAVLAPDVRHGILRGIEQSRFPAAYVLLISEVVQ